MRGSKVKKLIATMVLAASLSGCGSNGGAVGVDREGFNFSSTQGNFITTTVEVENRFFYILNRTDNNVSGLYAVTEEEGHDHAHGRIMTQEDDHDDDHEGEGEEQHADDMVPKREVQGGQVRDPVHRHLPRKGESRGEGAAVAAAPH